MEGRRQRAKLGDIETRLMKPGNDFRAFVRDCLEPRILPVYRTAPLRWHGCLHICRSLIFAEAMLGCYRKVLKVPANRFDAVAIRLALAWHDAGREDDGPDRWEAESARKASEFVVSCGFMAQYGDYVGSLITHRQTDPNAALVQACDTLEILRLVPLWAFDAERLSFLHPQTDPCAQGLDTAKKLRHQLIPEAKRWIQQTESKSDTLAASPTCCQDLLQDLAQSKDQHPTLANWLEDVLTT